MVWYSHLFQNFQQFVVIHTVKGFGVINKAEVDAFLELACFFMMFSAYKLNKQGDNIQPSRTPFPIWNQSVVPRLPGASVRNSAHGKCHEEGGSTYAKAGLSLKSPPGNSQASTPKTRACLLYYLVLSPTPLTFLNPA